MHQKTNKILSSFLLICLFLCPLFLVGQSNRIQQLESNLSNQQGLQYILDAMKLSDGYRDEGFYDKAIQAAEKAESEAKKSNERIYQAKALTIAARAYIKKGGKRDLRKANGKLNASQKMLGEKEELSIQLENILNLIKIAELRKKSRDIKKYERALSKLKGEMPEDEIVKVERRGGFQIFGKKKREAEAKLEASEEEKLVLAKELESVNEAREALEVQKDELSFVKEGLSEILAYKQQEILTMSEDKAKTELMLAKKQHVVDSLNFAGIRDSFALAQKEYILGQQKMELAESEAKIQIQESQRNLLIALATLVAMLAIGMYSRFVNMKKHNEVLAEKNKIIREEQARSEQLLLNILPVAIANELKLHGAAQTRLYKQATVVFIDFIGFSRIAAKLSPEQLVGDLDYCFKAFDKIIADYGLEKIKTIGDAYMCAGGLPKPSPEHPVNVIKAALEIQHFLAGWKLEKIDKGLPVFEARVGVHTGEIIAGVVGDIKFAYDIWGDTVNVASRMETSGEGGRVNISGTTYDLVKDKFKCEYRGKVPAKNMGEVDMYFVEN